jgi:Biotin operon repressor
LIYNSFNNTGLLKVLTFLKTHNTEYLSGQDLSDVLRISRVAVWKHIKKIQALGYTVESKQKKVTNLQQIQNYYYHGKLLQDLKQKH